MNATQFRTVLADARKADLPTVHNILDNAYHKVAFVRAYDRPFGVPKGNDACRIWEMYQSMVRRAHKQLVTRGLLKIEGRKYVLTEAGLAMWRRAGR